MTHWSPDSLMLNLTILLRYFGRHRHWWKMVCIATVCCLCTAGRRDISLSAWI